MRVLISSTTFIWNISRSKKNWASYDKKFTLIFMQSARYSCPILTKNLHFLDRFSKNTQTQN